VILWRGVRTGDRWLVAFPVAVAAAWIVVASNDIWGANQEPYRFWLDTFLLGLVCALPLLLRATISASGDSLSESPPAHASRAPRIAFALVVVLAVASAFDWAGWFRVQGGTVPIDLASPQLTAVATVAEEVDDVGLLVSEPCITPLMLKAVTGLPVAYYNLGMAWPSDRAAIDTVLVERETKPPSSQELEAANIRWVVTDSACESSWDLDDRDDLTLVATAGYDGTPAGSVQLWALDLSG
jgi:hypothetical protein